MIRFLIILLTALYACAFPENLSARSYGRASAVRKMQWISTDDVYKSFGDIEAFNTRKEIQRQLGAEPDLPIHVGFKYQRFGFMTASVWTWGGEYVTYVIEGHAENWRFLHASIDKAKAAELLNVSVDDLPGKPWSYRIPTGLIILLVIVAILTWAGLWWRKELRKH